MDNNPPQQQRKRYERPKEQVIRRLSAQRESTPEESQNMTFNKIVLDQSSEIEMDEFIKTVDDDVLENTSIEEEEEIKQQEI